MKQVLSFATFLVITGVFARPTALDGDSSYREQAHGRHVSRESRAQPQPAKSQVVGDTLVTDFTGSGDPTSTTGDESASTSTGNGSGRSFEALNKAYNLTDLSTKRIGPNITGYMLLSSHAHQKSKNLFDYLASDLIGRHLRFKARDESRVKLHLTAVNESFRFRAAPKMPAAHRPKLNLKATDDLGDIIGRSDDAAGITAAARTKRGFRRAPHKSPTPAKHQQPKAHNATAPPPPCATGPKVATMHFSSDDQNVDDMKSKKHAGGVCDSKAGNGTRTGTAPVLGTGTYGRRGVRI